MENYWDHKKKLFGSYPRIAIIIRKKKSLFNDMMTTMKLASIRHKTINHSINYLPECKYKINNISNIFLTPNQNTIPKRRIRLNHIFNTFNNNEKNLTIQRKSFENSLHFPSAQINSVCEINKVNNPIKKKPIKNAIIKLKSIIKRHKFLKNIQASFYKYMNDSDKLKIVHNKSAKNRYGKSKSFINY